MKREQVRAPEEEAMIREALERVRRARRIIQGAQGDPEKGEARGDASATKEAEELKASAIDLQSELELREGADERLRTLTEETSSELDKASDKLARGRAEAVRTKLKEVESRRDAKAQELEEILSEHDRAFDEWIRSVAEYSQDDSNTLLLAHPRIKNAGYASYASVSEAG